jgi:hypothetical protein
VRIGIGIGQHSHYAVGKAPLVAYGHQTILRARTQHFGGAAAPGRKHRAADSHGFQKCIAHAFPPRRQDEQGGLPIIRQGIFDEARKVDVGFHPEIAGKAVQLASFAPVAKQHKSHRLRPPRRCESAYQGPEILLRHQPADTDNDGRLTLSEPRVPKPCRGSPPRIRNVDPVGDDDDLLRREEEVMPKVARKGVADRDKPVHRGKSLARPQPFLEAAGQAHGFPAEAGQGIADPADQPHVRTARSAARTDSGLVEMISRRACNPG